MVLAINIIISASNLTHLQLASYRVIRPTSPHYFKLFNSALSSVRHRFARCSHRFRFAASFSVVFVFSIISLPSLSSSHRRPHLRHRQIAAFVFAIFSSPFLSSSYLRPSQRWNNQIQKRKKTGDRA